MEHYVKQVTFFKFIFFNSSYLLLVLSWLVPLQTDSDDCASYPCKNNWDLYRPSERIQLFFPPCFKMAESFENSDNILRDWAKDKGQKSLA